MRTTEYNQSSPRRDESRLISIQYNESGDAANRTVIVPPLKLTAPNSKTGLLTGRDRIFPLERIQIQEVTAQNNLLMQIQSRRNSQNKTTLTGEDINRQRKRSFGEIDDSDSLNAELGKFDRQFNKGLRPFKFPKAELEQYKHNKIFRQSGDASARGLLNQSETAKYANH